METFDSYKKLSYIALSDPGTMKFVYQLGFVGKHILSTEGILISLEILSSEQFANFGDSEKRTNLLLCHLGD